MMAETFGDHDLIFSPDDDGWYWQYGDKVSRLYHSRSDALTAFVACNIALNRI